MNGFAQDIEFATGLGKCLLLAQGREYFVRFLPVENCDRLPAAAFSSQNAARVQRLGVSLC
jgi:hypothetical protein